jgi:predicted protein tyrosine phosphatase
MIKTVKITDLFSIWEKVDPRSSQYPYPYPNPYVNTNPINIEEYTAWISLVGPEDEVKCSSIRKFMEDRNIEYFYRIFHDFDDKDLDVEFFGPSKQDINYLVNFLKMLKNDIKEHVIGINCYAGVSRSCAAGMIAWMIQGFSPSDALDKILEVRPMANPNCRILRFYDEMFGTDSSVMVTQWKAQQVGKVVAW